MIKTDALCHEYVMLPMWISVRCDGMKFGTVR